MFPTFGYVLIYAGVCVIQIQMMTQSEHNSSGQTHYTYDDFPRQRHKRIAKIISAAMMIGLRAKRALLNNATPTGRSRAHFKMYKKSGGIDQALHDFESVNPTIVMKSGGIIQAEVGDLTLLLINQGRKNPTLDIYKVSKTRGKTDNQVNEGAVTIIYED